MATKESWHEYKMGVTSFAPVAPIDILPKKKIDPERDTSTKALNLFFDNNYILRAKVSFNVK
jgi:hypothetical protein